MSTSGYEKDYYKILGVSKDAKPEQIKKAFRKIARENHPDQHPGDAKAEQRFKEASEANDVLSDPKKRKEYDDYRRLFGAGGGRYTFNRGPQGTQVRPEDFSRFMSDAGLGGIFGGLFNQAGGPRPGDGRPRPGVDIAAEATIGFEQAIQGATISLRISGEEACPACHGTGAKAGTAPTLCPACQGSGTETGIMGLPTACPECAGRGLVVTDPCETCHGSGKAPSQHTVQVRIPAGVNDGQKIRVKGKGGAGVGGAPAGDLYVMIHVRSHPIFGRQGDSLTVTVPVTFPEAALGAEISVPTMDGGPVKLRIPAGTPNGRTFRVRGRGIAKSGGTPGDLLATVEVQVPTSLSESARAALRDYVEAVSEPDPRRDLLAGAR